MAANASQQSVRSNVARILREEREKRGLSMTALGERTGLSQQMVSYMEREMRVPKLDTLLCICDALEIKLSNVIGRAEGMPGCAEVKEMAVEWSMIPPTCSSFSCGEAPGDLGCVTEVGNFQGPRDTAEEVRFLVDG